MALYEGGVSFLSRMPENTKLYKDLVMECLPEIEKEENLVTYNGRCV